MRLLAGCLLLFITSTCVYTQRVRWCVLENEMRKCQAMKQAFTNQNIGTIECIMAPYETACLRMIESNEADIKSCSDRGTFVGGLFHRLTPLISEKRTGPHAESFHYKAIVVVRKNSNIKRITDLKGKRSCHTGVLRTVGWVVPVGVLFSHAGMKKSNDYDACDNNVKNVARYFQQSCAPGAFDTYNNPNDDNPPNICSACQNAQECPFSGEYYGGYVGAFRGLVDNRCDVAFVKHVTPEDVKDNNITYTPSEYQLICPDGTQKALTEWNRCNWATRPTPTIMTRKNAPKQEIVKMLQDADTKFGVKGTNKNEFSMYNSSAYGGKNLMLNDATLSLSQLSSDYRSHLGDGFLNSYLRFRPEECKKSFRWCTVGDTEEKKCREFSGALGGQRITLDLTCVEGGDVDNCMQMIKDNRADVATMDGGHIYTAGRYYNLRPIVAEVYNTDTDDASYFAVAVTMQNKSVSLNNLAGKKSCHTGYGRTSGWNVPIGYLASLGHIKIDTKTCNAATAAANFFGSMCVPLNKGPAKLCSLCQHNNKGMYTGYTGAIRCLKEKDADVAFVKHTTIDDILKNREHWAHGLTKADFKLLCRNGKTAPIDQWRTCNLARVPSHAVMASKTIPADVIRHYQIALQRASMKYGKDSKSTFFKLFVSNGGSNLLFKDSTMKFKRIDSDYRTFLGNEYLKSAEQLDPRRCTSASTEVNMSFSILLSTLLFAVLW